MWKFWLILSGILLIMEIISVGFFFFWFSMGALVALVISFFIPNTFVQSFTFIISSTILLFATKPLVKKIIPKEPTVKTNSYSLEKKTGIVTVDVNPSDNSGQVRIGSEIWSAKSIDNTFIPKDTSVSVEKIEGVKAIVKPLENNN